jgi:hypothetical protein
MKKNLPIAIFVMMMMVVGLGAQGALVSADDHYYDIEKRMQDAEKELMEHAQKYHHEDDYVPEPIQQMMGAQILIKEPYPIQNRFVFICDVDGFEATSYDWHFGDGHQLNGMGVNDVYHQYKYPGHYEVTCVAHGDGESTTATRTIEAEHIIKSEAKLYVQEQMHNEFIFQCDTKGFEATWYTWFFGDTNKQITIGNDNVWHMYDQPGEYVVFCIATDGIKTQSDWMEIVVPGEPQQAIEDQHDFKYYDHKKYAGHYQSQYYDLKAMFEELEHKYYELENQHDELQMQCLPS